MKGIVSGVSFILFVIMHGHAQTIPPIEWQKCYGGTDAEFPYDIRETMDHGFIVCGYAKSTNGNVTGLHSPFSSDAWIVKLDNQGTLEWQKCYGGTGEETGRSIRQTPDSGYVFVGCANSNDGDVSDLHGQMDIWVVKLDVSGNIVWQKCLGGSQHEEAWSIEVVNGHYIIAGCTYSNDGDVTSNYGACDYWIIELDQNGNILWQKTYGGTGEDIATHIQPSVTGGFIVAGYSSSTDHDVVGHHPTTYDVKDSWILRLDNTGNMIWQKCLGGDNWDQAWEVVQGLDSNFVIANTTLSGNGDVTGYHAGFDAWVVKLGQTGNIIWEKCMGGTEIENGTTIDRTMDKGYIVGGSSTSSDGDCSSNHGLDDFWIIKLDQGGNIVGEKSFGGTSFDLVEAAHQTSDHGYIMAGETTSNNGDVNGNNGWIDYWVVKLAPEVGVSDPFFTGLMAYPNPASDFFQVQFENYNDKIKLELINIWGEVIYSTEFSGGSIIVNTQNISNGMYTYRLTANGHQQSRKIILN